MSYEQILYELSDTTAVVTINRPDKMNTWNADVASELSQALGQANTYLWHLNLVSLFEMLGECLNEVLGWNVLDGSTVV
jgi:1,4-dihydroxy-2-naphthoyl-CoA synthase